MTDAEGPPLVIGRYTLFDKIASGGMASVFLGRMTGAAGVRRAVAVKRLHPHLAEDPEFAPMLLDEARLTMRIRHPAVVATLDVVELRGELLIVMDYVVGPPLSQLFARARAKSTAERPPSNVVTTVMASVLHGLHAAHETRGEKGEPLNVIHRDVSPQNILVGADGSARILDFGIAKAIGRHKSTQDGRAKGKLGYMAPEQLDTAELNRTVDVYAAGVVLWEMLTLERLFADASEAVTIAKVLRGVVPKPSSTVSGIDPRLDEIVARALHRSPDERFPTAREMALALEQLGTVPTSAVADWVERLCGDDLRSRIERLREVETSSSARIVVSSSEVASLEPSTPLASTRAEVSISEGARSRDQDTRWRGLTRFGSALALLALGASVAIVVVQGSASPPPAAQAQAPAAAQLQPLPSLLPSATVAVPPPSSPREAPEASGQASPPAASAASSVALSPARRAPVLPAAASTAAPRASSSSRAKCDVVPIRRSDGTTDFVERCP